MFERQNWHYEFYVFLQLLPFKFFFSVGSPSREPSASERQTLYSRGSKSENAEHFSYRSVPSQTETSPPSLRAQSTCFLQSYQAPQGRHTPTGASPSAFLPNNHPHKNKTRTLARVLLTPLRGQGVMLPHMRCLKLPMPSYWPNIMHIQKQIRSTKSN